MTALERRTSVLREMASFLSNDEAMLRAEQENISDKELRELLIEIQE